MPVASNETVVRQFFELVWNQGDVAKLSAFMAPDFVSHNGLQVEISDSDGYAKGVSGSEAGAAKRPSWNRDLVIRRHPRAGARRR